MTHGMVCRRVSDCGYEALRCRSLTANEAVTRRWLKRKARRALRRELASVRALARQRHERI